jgi:sortase (surface protein transpeptidase)
VRLIRPIRRTAALSGAAVLGFSGAVVLGIGLAARDEHVPPPVAEAPVSSMPPPSTTTSAQPALETTPTPTPVPTARYTPSSSVRLNIPSVGMDLPLLALKPKSGVIDPPLLTAGYWIEPYGVPVGSADQATNTLYIAAHSAGRGDDGFDPLLTADHRGSALTAGDVIAVETPRGTVSYTVERTERYGKNALPDATEVWENSPGRLVLITCFQRADGRASTENLVVFAQS